MRNAKPDRRHLRIYEPGSQVMIDTITAAEERVEEFNDKYVTAIANQHSSKVKISQAMPKV